MESKFGVSIGRLECLDDEKWSLTGLDGQNLGRFSGVVVSDKSIASPRFTDVTGRPPPLGMMNLSLSSPGISINLLLCLLEYIKQTHFYHCFLSCPLILLVPFCGIEQKKSVPLLQIFA